MTTHYPAIYELDKQGEANGVIHFFCSEQCRSNSIEEGAREDVSARDLIDDTCCETCGKTLDNRAHIPRGDEPMTFSSQIIEYAAIIRQATEELETPNWTADLIAGGMTPDHLREMARRWRDMDFDPPSFADRVEQLADAVERSDV